MGTTTYLIRKNGTYKPPPPLCIIKRIGRTYNIYNYTYTDLANPIYVQMYFCVIAGKSKGYIFMALITGNSIRPLARAV
jgi:hypothetical protein